MNREDFIEEDEQSQWKDEQELTSQGGREHLWNEKW